MPKELHSGAVSSESRTLPKTGRAFSRNGVVSAKVLTAVIPGYLPPGADIFQQARTAVWAKQA